METRLVDVGSTSPVTGLKLSSVVPAKITGENRTHKLTSADLALKLHYLRGVWYFSKQTVEGLSIYDFKLPFFQLLETCNVASGRIRRSEENGVPFIRCNDSGVRIVEAHVEEMTMVQWLDMKDGSFNDRQRFLTYEQTIGPDLGFSPLIFLQYTWFKCGGLAIGLSWAHVLGDASSASSFMEAYGRIFAGGAIPILDQPYPDVSIPSTDAKTPPVKKIDPVGDFWKYTAKCSMKTFTFIVNAEKLGLAVFPEQNSKKISSFDIISAAIWSSMLKISGQSGQMTATVITTTSGGVENLPPANNLIFSTVEAGPNFSVAELAELITEKKTTAKQSMETCDQESDVIVYGANLTFCNLEECNVYGLVLNGEKAAFATYEVGGVGEEGLVLVLPAPEKYGGGARTVTVTFAGDRLEALKSEIRAFYSIDV